MHTSVRSGKHLVGATGLFVVLVALTFSFSEEASAQGFSIYEHGTCTMGRGGATVADPCEDASAVLYNPADLAGKKGVTISGGSTVIAVFGSYTHNANDHETDLDNDPIVVPHFYVSAGLTDRIAAGFGVFVPYGLGTVWPTEGFEGRFLGTDNSLQTIYLQPTVSYKITDQLSIGAGLDYAIGSVELNRRVDLSSQKLPSPPFPAGATFNSLLGVPAGYDFAQAKLKATGATGIGGNFGVQYKLNDRIGFGARYMLPIKLKYEGDATFTPVNPATTINIPAGNPFKLPAGPVQNLAAGNFAAGMPLGPQTIHTEITMPAQIVAGVSLQATEQLQVLFDYQWTGWSSFEQIPLDFEVAPDAVQHENFNDTHAFRLGAEYAVNDAFRLRAGVLTHGAAAPDETVTPLLPEARRIEYTAGLGWRFVPGADINVAYQFISQKDREGRVTDNANGQPPTTALNSGVYTFGAHLFATTLTVHF